MVPNVSLYLVSWTRPFVHWGRCGTRFQSFTLKPCLRPSWPCLEFFLSSESRVRRCDLGLSVPSSNLQRRVPCAPQARLWAHRGYGGFRAPSAARPPHPDFLRVSEDRRNRRRRTAAEPPQAEDC